MIRDLVWDALFGSGFDPGSVKDLDAAFFDPTDLTRERDGEAEQRPHASRRDVAWDANNQAAVHLWYPARFGPDVAPLPSALDGLPTWPETATDVPLRLDGGRLEVAAPRGLGDLLGRFWRRNPRRVTAAEGLDRIERKLPAQRWPGAKVLGPEQ